MPREQVRGVVRVVERSARWMPPAPPVTAYTLYGGIRDGRSAQYAVMMGARLRPPKPAGAPGAVEDHLRQPPWVRLNRRVRPSPGYRRAPAQSTKWVGDGSAPLHDVLPGASATRSRIVDLGREKSKEDRAGRTIRNPLDETGAQRQTGGRAGIRIYQTNSYPRRIRDPLAGGSRRRQAGCTPGKPNRISMNQGRRARLLPSLMQPARKQRGIPGAYRRHTFGHWQKDTHILSRVSIRIEIVVKAQRDAR